MLSNCEIRKRLTGNSKVKGGDKNPFEKKYFYECKEIKLRKPIIQQKEPIIPTPSAYVADRPPMKDIPKSSIPVAPPLPPPAEIIEDAVEKLSLKEVLKLNRKLNEGKKLNKTDEAELGKDDHMNLLLDAIKNPKLKKAKKRDVAPLRPRQKTPQELLMEELRGKVPKKDLEEAVEVGEGLWTKKGLFCWNKQGKVVCVPPSRFNPFDLTRSGGRRIKPAKKRKVKKGKKKTIKKIPKLDTEKMKKQIKKEKEEMKKELEMMGKPLPKPKKKVIKKAEPRYERIQPLIRITTNKRGSFKKNLEAFRALSLDDTKLLLDYYKNQPQTTINKNNVKTLEEKLELLKRIYKDIKPIPEELLKKPTQPKPKIEPLIKSKKKEKLLIEKRKGKVYVIETDKYYDYAFTRAQLTKTPEHYEFKNKHYFLFNTAKDRNLSLDTLKRSKKNIKYKLLDYVPAGLMAKHFDILDEPKKEEINDIMKAVMELNKLSTTEPVPYSSLSVLGNLMLLYTLKLNKNDCAIKVVSEGGKSKYILFLSFKNNKMINMNVEQMKEIINSYERCKKEGKILVIPISLKHRKGGHRNLLVLNYHRKEAERFEPHGAKTRSSNYDDEKINAGLEEFVMKLNLLGNLDLKYVPATETCPTGLRGFQSYEGKALKKTKTLRNKIRIGDYHGYCMAWSNFYSDLRLKFPKKSAREINDNAMKVFKKDPEKLRAFIRGQVLFIEKEFDKLIGKDNYKKIINIHNKKKKQRTKTEKQYFKQVLMELDEKIQKEYIKFTEAKEAPKEEPKKEKYENLNKKSKEVVRIYNSNKYNYYQERLKEWLKIPNLSVKDVEDVKNFFGKKNYEPIRELNNLITEIKEREEEPEPEPEPKTNNNIRNEEELKRFFDNYKDFKSARQQARVKKILEKITTKDNFEGLMNLLVSSKRYNDFFPTPQSCLDSEQAVNEIKKANHIYEPTAGLGSLIYGAYKINPNVKISANELMKDNADFIKHNFPNCKTTTEDFLKMDVKPNDYDLYLLNPPFTKGGDKRFYLNFLFKAFEFMENYKYNDNPNMIFFAPPMTERKDREEEVGDVIDLVDLRNVSKKKKLELYNEYKGENLKKLTKDEDDTDEFDYLIYEDLPIFQIQVIDTCKFQTTGMKVNVYLIIGTRDTSKPKRPDVMGSGCCYFCEEEVSGGDMAELLEDIRKGKKLNKRQEEIIKKSPNTIMDAVKERLKSIRKDVNDDDDDDEFEDDEDIDDMEDEEEQEIPQTIPEAPPLPVDEDGFIKDDKVLEPSIPQRIPQAPPLPQEEKQTIPQAPPLPPLQEEEPEPEAMEEPEQPIPQPPEIVQPEPMEKEDMFYTYQGTFIYDNDAMDLKNAFSQGLKDYYGGLLMDYGGYMENYRNDIRNDNVRNRHIQLMNVRNNYGY